MAASGSKGICFLDKNSPEKWKHVVEGRMDVVLDYDVPQELARSALAPKGGIVYCPRLATPSESFICSLGLGPLYNQYQISTMENATLFDFTDSTKNFPDGMRQDLDFLLSLLATRQLRPRIDRFIGLHETRDVSEDLKTDDLTGCIICEPWKKDEQVRLRMHE